MISSLRRIVVAAIVSCPVIAILPARGLAQVQPLALVTCESSGALRICPAATTWRGARLVKQISKTPCLQGENWGFDRRGIWVDKGCRGTFEAGDPFTNAGERVTCASALGRRVECPADTRFGVRLVQQISDSPCRENESWGTGPRAIWVDRGCRGEFEVGRGGQISPPVTSVRRLMCGAVTGAQVECPTQGRATSVRLVRELSSGLCRQNRSWGFSDAAIWTNRGCRGEFEVILVAPGGGPGPGPQLVTCGVTTGQYAACPANGPIKEVRLMRDVSGAGRCQPPQNWGHSNAEIWTRNGCRGEFQVIYHRGQGPIGPVNPPAPTRIIACGLVTGQQVECKTDGYATSVRLVREFSNGRCRQGSSWGNTDSFIWANRGCRAEFEVTYQPGAHRRRRRAVSFSDATCKHPGDRAVHAALQRNVEDRATGYPGFRCAERDREGRAAPSESLRCGAAVLERGAGAVPDEGASRAPHPHRVRPYTPSCRPRRGARPVRLRLGVGRGNAPVRSARPSP